ncbi:hypothetical protein DXG03_005579 [Asterophora parasitica]|uniref:CCHC-type domain-containing protein n=1 Tax=Asterophora parasitica TaxID=117018 RepID=A0A9P7FRN0_9AGAR|nr:hypothetical protein DXG03_005579 [Asterophora parasitica]
MKELAALGSEITNEDFSITLLTSLPDSWDPFISAIDSVMLKESHKLIARTLEEDRRLRARAGDTALAAKYNPNITCYNCNKKGHISSNCREPKKANGRGKKNRGGKGKGNSQKPDQAHQASDNFAFVTQSTNDIAFAAHLPADSMLADSTATSHIFRD